MIDLILSKIDSWQIWVAFLLIAIQMVVSVQEIRVKKLPITIMKKLMKIAKYKAIFCINLIVSILFLILINLWEYKDNESDISYHQNSFQSARYLFFSLSILVISSTFINLAYQFFILKSLIKAIQESNKSNEVIN